MKIDWPQIDTVLLDMDGTLLDLHFDNYFWVQHLPKAYADKHQMSEQAALDYLMPLFTSLRGTLNWYCVDFWSDLLKVDIMQLKSEVVHKIGYRPYAEEFLQSCQQKVEDLRLITNGHRKVLDLKIEHTKLDDYFVDLHCSHELGAPKEQQAFWNELQSIKPFNRERTLFIDDSESVLEAADGYGIKHIYSIAKPDLQDDTPRQSRFPLIDIFHVAEAKT